MEFYQKELWHFKPKICRVLRILHMDVLRDVRQNLICICLAIFPKPGLG